MYILVVSGPKMRPTIIFWAKNTKNGQFFVIFLVLQKVQVPCFAIFLVGSKNGQTLFLGKFFGAKWSELYLSQRERKRKTLPKEYNDLLGIEADFFRTIFGHFAIIFLLKMAQKWPQKGPQKRETPK